MRFCELQPPLFFYGIFLYENLQRMQTVEVAMIFSRNNTSSRNLLESWNCIAYTTNRTHLCAICVHWLRCPIGDCLTKCHLSSPFLRFKLFRKFRSMHSKRLYRPLSVNRRTERREKQKKKRISKTMDRSFGKEAGQKGIV